MRALFYEMMIDDKLSCYDPLDLAHNHSHFELKWRKTPRMVEEEEDKCFQVRRDEKTYYEGGVNIQTDRMVASYNRTTLTPSSAQVSGKSMDDSLNTATLVAMLLSGAVLVAVVIALLIYRYYRRTSGPVWISKLAFIRGRYRTMRNEEQATRDNFLMGFSNPITESSAQSVDKADGQVTVLGYRPLPEDGHKDGIKDYSLLYKQMFPRDRLVFGTDLGTGWFGKVYEADAYRIKAGWRRTKVVVKELRKNSVSQMKEVFLKETDVLRRVEHKNVLSVLGQATEQEPFLVILEHSSVGDLKKFLLEQRCDKKREGVPLPLRIAIDIASGLHCLHANYFYHSDLAARNCLVFPDLSVKIGDYGISRCVYKNDYYNRTNAPHTIPVRWLAPEGVVILRDGSLVTKPASGHGNVWSFGVTLWEIVEGGKQPYEELSDEEVLQSVIQDQLYQLPEPHNKGNVLDFLYEIMLQCWVDPERRPSVQKLESTLMSLMSGRSVPCLTTSGNLKQETELGDPQAAADTRNTAQPVAIVHPLRPDNNEPNSCESTALPSDSQDQEQNSSDVEVTVISSESPPPPVTYIGNPSEELGEASEVSAGSSTEVASLDSQSSVVVESDPGSDHEFVMVPGEVIRRRGSILKNPNAPSKPSKVVHFPVNILALRTVHKYERMESFEEGNNSVTDEEDGEDEKVVSMWSRDYPLSSFESDEYRCKFPVEKDFESLDLNSPEENETDSANESPPSPIEKKIRKAARRKKLEDCGQEWVTAIDSTEEALT